MIKFFEVKKVCDFTGDATVPGPFIVQNTDVILNMVARDTNGNIIDLTTLTQIKVEAKKRFTSLQDPIFTATLANNKVKVIDSATGRYNVELGPSDTDFVGEAKAQALYLDSSGNVSKSIITTLLFKESFVQTD